ncbi:hypothetical protein AVEN_201109-1 [Araneus ventricosus]|uniref:Uncharacterized protein n=1 Tax=Araneus ventricosus TaxID=182803 RepID=A0A4Y2UA09_ARAVE|nr:hypothetical protein AVEN_240773-1 [Araneus ventricosus]GBO08389.1 hypothetical protein AVEN_201109-1 [Araneus ventricosus]
MLPVKRRNGNILSSILEVFFKVSKPPVSLSHFAVIITVVLEIADCKTPTHQNRRQPFPFLRPLTYERFTPLLHHRFSTAPVIIHLGGVIVLGRQARYAPQETSLQFVLVGEQRKSLRFFRGAGKVKDGRQNRTAETDGVALMMPLDIQRPLIVSGRIRSNQEE